ncbi:MAG TPA: Imm1 family immunity protein, partial [Terriglobales bacterium]|nr:Imm1 family immunity protein [Terriglobales bacterium]
GEDGKYIVYATSDNMEFHNLINPKAAAGKILMVAGGQRGDYLLKQCVSLPDVLRTARTYAETGELDPGLTWEKQH